MMDYWYPYMLLFVGVAFAVIVQISPNEMSHTFSNVANATKMTATEPCNDHTNNAVVDRLRDRMVQLTNKHSKVIALLVIAQQQEHMLALLEREKYE